MCVCTLRSRGQASYLQRGKRARRSQKELFLGLTDVLWQITPALKNSLSRDLASLGDNMREGWHAVAHLIGRK